MKQISPLLIAVVFLSCQQSNKQKTHSNNLDTIPNSGITLDTLSQARVYPDILDVQNTQKAVVSKSDSSFSVYGNIKKDYRIFGYEKPDTNATRLILFSVFTRDVDHNPYKCRFGAYYQTGALEDTEIKFKATVGSFIATDLFVMGKKVAEIYFEKRWIDFAE